MNIVYDLFLNFEEIAFDFFEWNKQDTIDHIKKIPLFRVSTKTLQDFVYKSIQVEEVFLKEIYNMTEKYDLGRLEYACLFSDGKASIALEFAKDGTSMYKSHLLLEDEEEVAKYVFNEKETTISYKVLSKEESKIFFTRKERKIRNLIEREIIKTYQNQEKSKMQYLYLEYFDEMEQDICIMKTKLLDSMKENLNKKHFALYDLLLLLSKKKKV